MSICVPSRFASYHQVRAKYVLPFGKPSNNPKGKADQERPPPFYWGRNWGSERCSDWPRLTQPEGAGTGLSGSISCLFRFPNWIWICSEKEFECAAHLISPWGWTALLHPTTAGGPGRLLASLESRKHCHWLPCCFAPLPRLSHRQR